MKPFNRQLALAALATVGMCTWNSTASVAQNTPTKKSASTSQSTQKQGNRKTTTSPMGSSATSMMDDADFLKKAYEGGLAEIELGRLAQEKASSDKVKRYGQTMIDMHTMAGQEIASMVSGKGGMDNSGVGTGSGTNAGTGSGSVGAGTGGNNAGTGNPTMGTGTNAGTGTTGTGSSTTGTGNPATGTGTNAGTGTTGTGSNATGTGNNAGNQTGTAAGSTGTGTGSMGSTNTTTGTNSSAGSNTGMTNGSGTAANPTVGSTGTTGTTGTAGSGNAAGGMDSMAMNGDGQMVSPEIQAKADDILSTELNAEHKALKARLSKLSGAEFDRQYLQAMVKDHTKMLQMVSAKAEEKMDSPSAAQEWAKKHEGGIREHLEDANKLVKNGGK